jgi:Protein of unknwon function (DUF3310)
MNSANTVQMGGTHYKDQPFQHWDFVAQMDLNYFEGNITKYLSRFRHKNGVEDLRKAWHYTLKYSELLLTDSNVAYIPARLPFRNPTLIQDFCEANKLPSSIQIIFNTLIMEIYARASKHAFQSMLADIEFMIVKLDKGEPL